MIDELAATAAQKKITRLPMEIILHFSRRYFAVLKKV
jgi:hypothetical protein